MIFVLFAYANMSYLIFFVLQQAILLLEKRKKNKYELMIWLFPAHVISANLSLDNNFTCFFMSISCCACCWTKALFFDISSSWKIIDKRNVEHFSNGNQAKRKGIVYMANKTDFEMSTYLLGPSVCLSVRSYFRPSVCLSFPLSVCLSVCMSFGRQAIGHSICLCV